MANDYVRTEKTVTTNDIYHEIGWLICNSLEEIRNIRYYEIKKEEK